MSLLRFFMSISSFLVHRKFTGSLFIQYEVSCSWSNIFGDIIRNRLNESDSSTFRNCTKLSYLISNRFLSLSFVWFNLCHIVCYLFLTTIFQIRSILWPVDLNWWGYWWLHLSTIFRNLLWHENIDFSPMWTIRKWLLFDDLSFLLLQLCDAVCSVCYAF